MASSSSNPPPTWATQDPDEQPVRVRASEGDSKHSSADVDEELEVAAASSVVGSSPVKPIPSATDKMQVDEEEDAETARNRAAEALSDLANAAVFAAPLPVKAPPVNSSIAHDTPASIQPPHINTPVDTLARKQRRPAAAAAALLTPTRRSGGPSKTQHLSPNPPAAGQQASSSWRSPLGTNIESSTASSAAGSHDAGTPHEQHLSHLATSANGTQSPLYATSPNRAERAPVVEKGKSAYNSPFTSQPFVAGAHDSSSNTPMINTGTRKDVPTYHVLRKEDGEMCTRVDLQYDLLNYLFSNTQRVFTIPPFVDVPKKYDSATHSKLTFGELYCYTLASSKRSTKQLKEALLDLEPGSIPGKHQAGKAYRTRKRGELAKGGTDSVNASPGVETQMDELKEDMDELGNGESSADGYDGLRDGYAKICLLVNVGRINTTFAFYPAMRTVLRTYHSVPSLQKTQATRKSLQDAPRMKNALKAIRLSTEPTELPSSLEGVLSRLHAGHIPPTSVVNLLFLLGLGHDIVSEHFFDQENIVDPHNLLATRLAQPGSAMENGRLHLLHLFTTINIRSEERANMLLYILYHYLESDGHNNPFSDAHRPGRPPILRILDDKEYEALGENIDEADELEWGAEMRARRIESLKELAIQKQSAANTPGLSLAYTTASAATSARNSIEPSVLSHRTGIADAMDSISDRHSDVGIEQFSSRKRKRYSPLGHEGASGTPLANVNTAKQGSRMQSPAYVPQDVMAYASRRGSPHMPSDVAFDPRSVSRSQSQSRTRVSPSASRLVLGPSVNGLSDSEDEEPKPVIRGRRDRNDPRAMQDDWAHGVDISGLDEETVRHLIYQVNLEFGDPPTPEPEIAWKEYERTPYRSEEQRKNPDEDYFLREDSRRRSYGNALSEGRPAISPEHKNTADDLHSRQSPQSPGFAQREIHYERQASTHANHFAPVDRQPVSPPVRKVNSLSALLN
ncbi:hypothetical protein NliqN6_4688 [Naganishia liquefaciens]|uniref:Uncharacterized protein n=1 Tax=Naganishia liquefaciens TaxID=104408 RepID=A0A8H3YI71_9TREE|nr:hypothetical protein NliqN6_4688 [Naganishia liquefaciens]